MINKNLNKRYDYLFTRQTRVTSVLSFWSAEYIICFKKP